MAQTGPNGPGGPTFIPISLIPDNPNIITAPSSVGFTITVPPGQGQPPLTVSYYAVQSQPGPPTDITPIEQELLMDVIAMPNGPTPVWQDGIARFTLDLNQAVFNILPAKQIVLTVCVRINDPNKVSAGIAGIPINLP